MHYWQEIMKNWQGQNRSVAGLRAERTKGVKLNGSKQPAGVREIDASALTKAPNAWKAQLSLEPQESVALRYPLRCHRGLLVNAWTFRDLRTSPTWSTSRDFSFSLFMPPELQSLSVLLLKGNDWWSGDDPNTCQLNRVLNVLCFM